MAKNGPLVMKVDGELVDKIVATEAKRMIAMFRQDLRDGNRIFYNNAQADRAEIKRHLEAFELVRRYYSAERT
jgi:hypothetical protein